MSNTTPDRGDSAELQIQLSMLGQFGASLGCGWWALISLGLLIYNGQLFSWVGLFMFVPGELLGLLVPVPITALLGFLLMAAHRIVGFNALVFTLTLAAHMFVSLAAEVVAVIWFHRFLCGWVG